MSRNTWPEVHCIKKKPHQPISGPQTSSRMEIVLYTQNRASVDNWIACFLVDTVLCCSSNRASAHINLAPGCLISRPWGAERFESLGKSFGSYFRWKKASTQNALKVNPSGSLTSSQEAKRKKDGLADVVEKADGKRRKDKRDDKAEEKFCKPGGCIRRLLGNSYPSGHILPAFSPVYGSIPRRG